MWDCLLRDVCGAFLVPRTAASPREGRGQDRLPAVLGVVHHEEEWLCAPTCLSHVSQDVYMGLKKKEHYDLSLVLHF